MLMRVYREHCHTHYCHSAPTMLPFVHRLYPLQIHPVPDDEFNSNSRTRQVSTASSSAAAAAVPGAGGAASAATDPQPPPPLAESSEAESKRQKRLALNRKAAKESRERKKKRLEALHHNIVMLTRDNHELRGHNKELRDLVASAADGTLK